MEQELDKELMDKLCKALGRPREEVTWEGLQGMNQRAISVYIDARNTHLVMTRLEAEGDRRGLARMRALQQPNAGAWLCHASLQTQRRVGTCARRTLHYA